MAVTLSETRNHFGVLVSLLRRLHADGDLFFLSQFDTVQVKVRQPWNKDTKSKHEENYYNGSLKLNPQC